MRPAAQHRPIAKSGRVSSLRRDIVSFHFAIDVGSNNRHGSCSDRGDCTVFRAPATWGRNAGSGSGVAVFLGRHTRTRMLHEIEEARSASEGRSFIDPRLRFLKLRYLDPKRDSVPVLFDQVPNCRRTCLRSASRVRLNKLRPETGRTTEMRYFKTCETNLDGLYQCLPRVV